MILGYIAIVLLGFFGGVLFAATVQAANDKQNAERGYILLDKKLYKLTEVKIGEE